MVLRIVRESWVVKDGGAVAVNVKSGVVVTIDETESSPIRLYAYHISSDRRAASAVDLGTYPSRREAVAAVDQIVNSTG